MNDFSRITVCAVDCLTPKLAARALERSMEQCDFADALLLTDQEVETRARVEKIGAIRSRTEYSRFMLRDLGPYIRTDYVLVVQWDGFVLDASQWRSGFLDFDYIGAPWPVQDRFEVGNGGFSLRSRRLLNALSDPDFPDEEVELEDQCICITQRPWLEVQHGIRFAPRSLAQHFSYELVEHDGPTFGFHGLFNMWRHHSDEEILSLVPEFSEATLTSDTFSLFLYKSMARGKYQFAQRLLERIIDRLGEGRAMAGYRKWLAKDQATADAFIKMRLSQMPLHG